MKTKNIITFGVLLLTISLGFGCKKEEKPAAAAAAAATGGGAIDTGLATAAFMGVSDGVCFAMPAAGAGLGNAFNGFSYQQMFSSYTDGTVRITTLISNNGTCTGTNIMTFSQTATVTNQGLATSPAGATEFLFTITDMDLTIFTGNPWATTINNACLTTGFNTAATSTVSMLGRTCFVTPGTVENFSFPATNGALYNVVTKSGSTLTFGVPANFIFNVGQYATYPTSVARTFVIRP